MENATIPDSPGTYLSPALKPTFKLPRYFHPEKVMANPQLLKQKIVEYFHFLEPPNHPTPPGLAMALGLASFDSLLKILKNEEATPGTYDPASMQALYVARSLIEDYYINGGLREALPSQFVKFLLSAFFNRSEKTIQEQLGQAENSIQINILGISGAAAAQALSSPDPIHIASSTSIANETREQPLPGVPPSSTATVPDDPTGGGLTLSIAGVGYAGLNATGAEDVPGLAQDKHEAPSQEDYDHDELEEL